MHIRDDSPASLIISVDFESDTSPGYLVYWTNNFDRETKVVIIIQFGRMAIILLSQSSSFFRLDIVRYALMRQRHGILRLPHAPPGCNAGVTQIAVVQHSLSLYPSITMSSVYLLPRRSGYIPHAHQLLSVAATNERT
jgi:hypothetical protein